MRSLYTFLLCIFMFSTLSAQSWTSYFKQSRVNDFYEEENQVWVATDAGVFIINKAEHTVEHWTAFNAGLPSNHVEKIARHPETGQMFIGTYDVGIALKSPEGWLPLPYPEEFTENPNLLTFCFDWDSQGRLWVGTNQGLLRYEDEEWTVVAQEGPTEFLFQVWQMERDPDGNLLLAGNTLVKVTEDSLSLLTPVDFTGQESLFSYGSAHLEVQENGVIWYFTDIGTVGRFEGDSLKIFSSIDQENPVAFNQIQFVTEDDSGNLWAYLEGWGFYRYTTDWEAVSFGEEVDEAAVLGLHFLDEKPLFIYPGEAQFGVLEPEHVELVGYPFAGPLSNYQYDWEGNLWLKEGSTQLYQVDQDISYPIVYEGEPWVFNDYTIAPDGSIWFIRGKSVYHQTEMGWEVFDPTNSTLPDTYGYRHIVSGSDGKIWIQVYNKGIYYYDGMAWDHYHLPVPADNYVASMVAATDGSIWVASWDNYVGNRIIRITTNDYKIYKESDIGIEEAYVRELFYESENNRLWLATGQGELYTFEAGNWALSPISVDQDEFGLVNGVMVKNGLLVLHSSTARVGLYQDENWTVFHPHNAPLTYDAIADVGLDQTGQLWISHFGDRGAVEIYESGVVISDAEQIDPGYDLSISPNPAVDFIRLQFEEDLPSQPVVGRVYTANGQLNTTFQIEPYALQSGVQVSLEHLTPGLYYLQLNIGQTIVKRFVKTAKR